MHYSNRMLMAALKVITFYCLHLKLFLHLLPFKIFENETLILIFNKCYHIWLKTYKKKERKATSQKPNIKVKNQINHFIFHWNGFNNKNIRKVISKVILFPFLDALMFSDFEYQQFCELLFQDNSNWITVIERKHHILFQRW